MEQVLPWDLLALAVPALGYLGIGLFVALRPSTIGRQPIEQTSADDGLDFREVSFESTDGLKLKGWWAPGDGSTKAVVLVHGLEGNKSDQHVLKTASVYQGAGYSVLMLGLRGNGESGGGRTTIGYQEVWDAQGAHFWLEERNFGPNEVVLHS